ncbi:MAG: RodZ domain-containing protein [Gammaproteobacteria bacterium]
MDDFSEHSPETLLADESGGLLEVGEKLKAARIKKNMRVDEAAQRLRLGADIVLAIESGQTDALPGVAFTRGYVRSYAKLLGLDEKTILSELGGSADNTKIHLTQNKPIHYRKQYPVGKWLRWFAIAAALTGLVFLLMPLIERLLSNEGVQSDAPGLVIPGQSGVGGSLLFKEVITVGSDSQSSVAANHEPVSVAPKPVDIVPADTRKKLILSVRQDCWIEVKFDGKKHLAGIVKMGQKKTFEAKSPIEVLLGNAPAVIVEFDGKLFNHSLYTKGKVARFSLGQS